MSIIVDIEPLLRKYDGMNEGTEFSPIHFINDFLMLLEQQPSEDTEVIKVSKGAVKARQGRFVIYDVEWFKEHFYSEEMIYGQPKQPCEDCISRESVIEWLKNKDIIKMKKQEENARRELATLPPVTPQRPKGKWIKYKSRFGVYFKCSECGKKLNWIDRDDNYCNNCGSDNSESTKEWFKEWDTSIAEMSGGGEDADSN